jgi:hypothetical protein
MDKLVLRKIADRCTTEERKKHGRSAITNGRDLLEGIDGRCLLARRYRDISLAIASDQGGADRLSETRLQLIRRFAAAACLAEQLEAKLVRGEQVDIQEHSLLVSTMLRVAQRIGIDRRAKNITPTLGDYLSSSKAIGTDAEAAE